MMVNVHPLSKFIMIVFSMEGFCAKYPTADRL